jgi:hypothetical protein
MADNNTTLPKQASTELGQSGTVIQQGIITQEEYNQNLVGIRANQKYEIMRRSDSTVRSALQVVKLPIQSAKYDIEAVKDDDGVVTPEDQEKADYIKRELFNRNINFEKFIKAALTQFDFGYSVFEKVYELTEFNGSPRIGLKKLASRKQLTIVSWETEDGNEGITQLTRNGHRASIPRDKLVIFTHDQEGDNYEGVSLLRYVYKEWDIKDKLTIVNAIALEKLGVGVPIVRARDGETMTTSDENDAIDALSNMRANQKSYLKIPKTATVEMLDLKGNTTKDVLPTIIYLDGRIMTAILARFMELGGSSGTGAEALSKDLSSLFMKSEEAVVKDMVATIFEDVIKQLCDFNYSDMSGGYPKLTFGSIADDDTIALATAIGGLVSAGAFTPDPELENDLRGRFKVPLLSKEAMKRYDEPTPEDETKTTNTKKATDNPASDKKQTDQLEKDKEVTASLESARQLRSNLSGLLGSAAGV